MKTKNEYYEMRLYKCFGFIVRVKRTKHLLIHQGRNFVIKLLHLSKYISRFKKKNHRFDYDDFKFQNYGDGGNYFIFILFYSEKQ